MEEQLPTNRPYMFRDLAYANGIEPLKPGSTEGKVFITCARCEETSMVILAIDDYMAWTKRQLLAHEAFPYITRDKLTLLESGLCLTCFDKLWTERIHDNPNEAFVYPDTDDDHVVG